MKRSRFSDEQIIAIVKEQEAGMATVEVCRRHGISGATFYKWKSPRSSIADCVRHPVRGRQGPATPDSSLRVR